IALVGPTGAGKSTLVNLLPAFYELTGGRITIDGHDISRLTLESLRSQISVVSQEPFLFNGTIRENISYGRLEASEQELIAAARTKFWSFAMAKSSSAARTMSFLKPTASMRSWRAFRMWR